MSLQKISLKLFVDVPGTLPLEPFLPIFARWRENKTHASGWVDLADYAHVRNGPGVMIIGHQGNLGMDLTDPGPGILYCNKKDLEGTTEERVLDTFRRTLPLARALTAEPEYPKQLAPRPGFWELVVNDRMQAPNTDETEAALRPGIDAALERIFGGGRYTAVREKDPLRRYGFIIHSDSVGNLEEIAERL